MDRSERVARLVEHAREPRHAGSLPDADVKMPGGSPECGGSVTVYLKGEGENISGLTFEGQGDTISMGATSLAVEKVHAEGLTMEEVLALDYDEFVTDIGKDVVGSRTRNATMGLSTVKSAIRKYRRDRLTGNGRLDAEAV
ncbi:NifU like protein involved in Fe-S cluster formation [Rubrobacter radiotolerans]|uniref:Iron-sulfur cluster assembly scaffold protein n=1 Tax=Rubrobacter radiotolerans TaxID=42256 RepID=A0A023X282_RUBRA|nr:iron-sulfur cluster assembly scaffold protein [Rubrobacter radiotolerans]AHY46169.1 NifU like protein involved in Fe-S cluster formation [Rubrobacter radiotolerans]MDX5893579.1 iron-sulfur cluster assembly scaffold protein [Rubrobacter radiotolerans]SMC04042.1 nitrogen fixation protein NifU [Rubrobacter radiotolerans DSM 5868]